MEIETHINERGRTVSFYLLQKQKEVNFCHVFYPNIHTDRPRCYALMREDYLWSPLQSACSMQHLRSVSSVGRQCRPPPTLTCPKPPLPTTFFYLTLPVLFLSAPLLHFLPCRYPQWCVSTLLLPASSSPDFITCKLSMEITPDTPRCLVHTHFH